MSILTISILVLLSILLIVILTSVTKLNAFASLFIVSLLLAVIALPDKNVVEILKQGFGSTMASIGFLIIFGAIIAVVLEKTGGAVSIANYILSKTGHSKAASAMGITGFIVGLPIFCDSGYIIMSGLAKSFSFKAKIALPFIAFVLATSLYSVHCLTPTHPGALAASGILDTNIGMLILLGTLFAIPAALSAFLWVKWQTRKDTYQEIKPSQNEIQSNEELPSVRLSLLPIVTPLILIAFGSLLAVLKVPDANVALKGLAFIGQPIIALMIGVLLSLLLLKNKTMKIVNSVLESAIEKAGPILIVTGAGGMFGLVIKETGVGAYAGEFLLQTGLGLAVPFLIATILKTAQGFFYRCYYHGCFVHCADATCSGTGFRNRKTSGNALNGSRFNDGFPRQRLLFLGGFTLFGDQFEYDAQSLFFSYHRDGNRYVSVCLDSFIFYVVTDEKDSRRNISCRSR